MKVLFLTETGLHGHEILLAHTSYCKFCDKITSFIFCPAYNNTKARYLIVEPCARIVLGIHPDVHDYAREAKIELPFSWKKTVFICYSCGGFQLIEKLAEEVSEIRDKLSNTPIIDMPEYEKNKGCWITLTEFMSPQKNRFLNYQTDLNNFKGIIDAVFAEK